MITLVIHQPFCFKYNSCHSIFTSVTSPTDDASIFSSCAPLAILIPIAPLVVAHRINHDICCLRFTHSQRFFQGNRLRSKLMQIP